MSGMFSLRDLPKYEAIRQRVSRYPDVQPAAVESFLVLLRVASDVLVALESHLGRREISQGRFNVLMVLNRDPSLGLAPSDLALRCGVTRATMTGLLNGLERDGLITRQPDAQDRRMTTCCLTPKGIAYLDTILPDFYVRIAQLMGNLSEEEKLLFEKLLWKVNEGITALTQT